MAVSERGYRAVHLKYTTVWTVFPNRWGMEKGLRSMERKQLNLAEVGERVRNRRESLNLSREQIAEIMDVSTESLRCVERGLRALSLKEFQLLSRRLETSAEYLLFGKHS